jgi:hypothetical protein
VYYVDAAQLQDVTLGVRAALTGRMITGFDIFYGNIALLHCKSDDNTCLVQYLTLYEQGFSVIRNNKFRAPDPKSESTLVLGKSKDLDRCCEDLFCASMSAVMELYEKNTPKLCNREYEKLVSALPAITPQKVQKDESPHQDVG